MAVGLLVLACPALVRSEPGATAVAGDLRLGAAIMITCAACHGEHGQGSRDGTYPRLAGLRAGYVARQLRLFKTHERINIPMLPYATERELPEPDVEAIAGYLASIRLSNRLVQGAGPFDALGRLRAARNVYNIPVYPGDPASGKKLYDRECASCHGRDGLGREKGGVISPRLSGQHSLYLRRQMDAFAAGSRLHDEPDDASFFASLQPEGIRDVLSYLSLLDD